MSAYIPPVLNNGVLNSTFNSADFESTYPDSFLPLSGGNITGSLGVSGAVDAHNDLTVSGNVGIGAASPETALDVCGNLIVRGSLNKLLFYDMNANNVAIRHNDLNSFCIRNVKTN